MTDPNTPSTEGTPSVPPLPPTAPSTPPAPSYGAPSAPSAPPAYTPPAAEPSTPSYGAPSYQQAPPANPYAQAPNAAPYGQPYSPVASAPKTLSLIGMIAGILGLVISLFSGGFGLIFSIGAVVLGFLGKKREPAAKGFWLTALITGFVGIGVTLVWVIIWVLIFASAAATSSYNSY
ncbi:DUF4190 domain-containing protein [Agreia pratensis]|uniref:Uncharacterized membrane protein YeaQ/YmgE, transglycosylase-associated protein family n=1 Tax=Agreia pratensis TaxID=150121 RepID=A0A1X7JTN5_9MICO|nr:DUF4190 domain-containing protein [Agreia pratensis]MBF4635459.1 DUF4190 domain-containing protein [Agreia pratensis]SMG31179.1 Uncharacterized membrane protein YeaQ/YmgE, transglycosylase-associated protein family [Agreia pratensis]